MVETHRFQHRKLNARNTGHYKSRRHSSGNAQNNLTVESFGFVNIQTCSKLVERSMPPLYRLTNKNEVMCFASEEHYITNEDAGAPVVQAGKLVGVTVGGTVCDGDHVAVAMKIACFCQWMSEYMPKSNSKALHCCEDCCAIRKKSSNKDVGRMQGIMYHKPIKRGRQLSPDELEYETGRDRIGLGAKGVGGELGGDYSGDHRLVTEDRPAEAMLAYNGRVRGGVFKPNQRGSLQVVQDLTMLRP